MQFLKLFVITWTSTALVAATPVAAPKSENAECAEYEIITVRGTTEPQDFPLQERSYVNGILKAAPGGTVYKARYPASIMGIMAGGPMQAANDILKHLQGQAGKCPGQAFVLYGYSQGAMGVVTLLHDKRFAKFSQSLAATLLLGNPYRNPADKTIHLGSASQNSRGSASMLMSSLPQQFQSKTADLCNDGDPVCSSGLNFMAHLSYSTDPAILPRAINFVAKRLKKALSNR